MNVASAGLPATAVVDQLRNVFRAEGIEPPPVPGAFVDLLTSLAPCAFAAGRGGRVGPIDVEEQVRSLSRDASALLYIAFAGHGVSSNVLHYWLVHGRLAVFLVRRWGNVYDDPQVALRRIEGAFEVVAELLACCDRLSVRNALPAGKTLVVVDTEDGRQRCGWSDLSPASLGALDAPDDAPALYSALMDLLERESSAN